MVWSVDMKQGDDASKIRWELVPYTSGRVLDIGCGRYKTFPHFVGVDKYDYQGNTDIVVDSAEKLDLIASQSCDAVFSSHLLEHIQDYKAALKEWWRVIKPNGYLCLYLPHKEFYPNIGAEFTNPDHKHDFMPADIIAAMEEIGGWDLVQCEDRNQDDEYSFFQVYKKLNGKQCRYSCRDFKPAKTCAVVRYGAFGDMIQTSSILPGLKEQGYHVTLYCSDAGYEIIKTDPHVDRFIIQKKDQVPPDFLGEFWEHEQKKYDRWINLSESVEGTLLAMTGRANHGWSHEIRHKYMNRNYLEWTHELADVPPPYRQHFYSTSDEKRWARKTAEKWGKRNVLWSLAGSSGHKVWPHMDAIIARLMLTYRDSHVVLVGDESCQILEGEWNGREPRVHCKSGIWSIRESMAFAEVADLVIGTETGLLNAAGMMETPKICTLSHSSAENLTKHWKNTISLMPSGLDCYPCHRLHHTWDFCKQEQTTGTAMCQYMIGIEEMWQAVKEQLGWHRAAA